MHLLCDSISKPIWCKESTMFGNTPLSSAYGAVTGSKIDEESAQKLASTGTNFMKFLHANNAFQSLLLK